MMLMPLNWRCVFCFPRLLFGVGQSDGSSDLQHQQHDRTGALHAAGPPLAAPGRKAYSLMRCRSLHAAHTHLSLLCSATCAWTGKHRIMHCMHTVQLWSSIYIHTRDELLRQLSNTVSISYTSLPKTLSNSEHHWQHHTGRSIKTAAQEQKEAYRHASCIGKTNPLKKKKRIWFVGYFGV